MSRWNTDPMYHYSSSVLSIALHMSIDHFCSFVPAGFFPQPSILPGRGQTVLGSWGIAVIPLLILCCTPPSLPPFLRTLPPPLSASSFRTSSFLPPSLAPSFLPFLSLHPSPSLPVSPSLHPSLHPSLSEACYTTQETCWSICYW